MRLTSNIINWWPCTPTTIYKTSRDTSYCAARARVSPPSLRVINWKRRLGLGRRWPPNKSETCTLRYSCFRRNLPSAETGPARRPPITRRVLAYIIISSLYTKNWFYAEIVCAVAFVRPPPPRRGFGWRRRVAKKPGPEPEPNPPGRPAGCRWWSVGIRPDGERTCPMISFLFIYFSCLVQSVV